MRILLPLFLSFFLISCGGGDSSNSNTSENSTEDTVAVSVVDSTNDNTDIEVDVDGNTGGEPSGIVDNINDTNDFLASSLTVTPEIAAKFLTQATYGATEANIDALVSQNNLEAWVDQQIALPVSLTQPYVEANSNGSLRSTRHDIWWKNVIENDDQLRQRMAFALSQIFVISDLDYDLSNSQYAVTNYYDMLAENAFGNYRDLLEKVTLHATMGIYLGMVRNQKENPELRIRPDENYAREVLQLFSIGLNELNQQGEAGDNPVPTYDQETIENFAKVFTGWNFSDSSGTWVSGNITQYDKRLQMIADYDTPDPESYHDTSAKTLLNGVELPSSSGSATATEDDMEAALDNIANHPNVGPFLSHLLIQRFTTSNPSPAYVGRVAAVFNNNGQGERGDLGAVVKAILLDKEALLGKAENPDFGKVKEPLMQLTQLWRAFDVQLGASNDIYRFPAKASGRLFEVFGQEVLSSPSVFNFFLPDNLLAGDSTLFAPEMQIMTEANIASIHNAFRSQIYEYNNQDNRNPNGSSLISIDKAVQLAPNPVELIDYLDRLLLAGELPENKKAIIADHLNTLSDNIVRAEQAIFLIVASADFMVQE